MIDIRSGLKSAGTGRNTTQTLKKSCQKPSTRGDRLLTLECPGRSGRRRAPARSRSASARAASRPPLCVACVFELRYVSQYDERHHLLVHLPLVLIMKEAFMASMGFGKVEWMSNQDKARGPSLCNYPSESQAALTARGEQHVKGYAHEIGDADREPGCAHTQEVD